MRRLIYEIGQIYQLKITSLVRSTVFEDQGCISSQRPQDVPLQIFIVKISFFRDQIGEKGIVAVILNQFKSGHFHKRGFPVSISSGFESAYRMVIGTPIHFIGRGGKILRRLSFQWKDWLARLSIVGSKYW
jgi:hypothetical protein